MHAVVSKDKLSSRPPLPLKDTRPPTFPNRPTVLLIPKHQDFHDDEDNLSIGSSYSQDPALDSIHGSKTISTKKSSPYSCLDADQIDRDVSRCTWHLLTGSQRSTRLQMENKHRKKIAQLLRKKQRRLGKLINLTLLRSYEDQPSSEVSNTDDDEKVTLSYYQGYHDVASIFMSTLGGASSSTPLGDSESVSGIAESVGLGLASAVLSRVSFSHFRDAMRSNFMQLQAAIRLIVMPLISYFDKEVHEFLLDCDMEPFFALSWIITWFSHDVRDTALVKRLFDAFLVSHPLLPIYVTVAMVCHPNNRAEILATECDFAPVHSVLSALPKNSSMIGWRYRPSEGGYVSGDETDDDAQSSTMEMSDLMDSQYYMEGRDDVESETYSLISSQVSVGSRGTKVPFQELINNALMFMRRVPPRKLIHLTKMYYSKHEDTIQPMLQITPTIHLFKPHPKWGLLPSAPADWVLKQRKCRTGRSSSRKRNIRRRSRSRSQSHGCDDGSCGSQVYNCNGQNKNEMSMSVFQAKSIMYQQEYDDSRIVKFLDGNKRMLAVIACGFGAGDEDDVIDRKRRRWLLGLVVTTVAIVSVTFVMMSGDNDTTATPIAPSVDSQCLSDSIGSIDVKKSREVLSVPKSLAMSKISKPNLFLSRKAVTFSKIDKCTIDMESAFALSPIPLSSGLRGQARNKTPSPESLLDSTVKALSSQDASLISTPQSFLHSFSSKGIKVFSKFAALKQVNQNQLGGFDPITKKYAIILGSFRSAVDRMVDALPCRRIPRLVKEYVMEELRKLPQSLRALERFLLHPILRRWKDVVARKQVPVS
jgi:Rab-GTPase-TBC domain